MLTGTAILKRYTVRYRDWRPASTMPEGAAVIRPATEGAMVNVLGALDMGISYSEFMAKIGMIRRPLNPPLSPFPFVPSLCPLPFALCPDLHGGVR
jgi:hypothetical protein